MIKKKISGFYDEYKTLTNQIFTSNIFFFFVLILGMLIVNTQNEVKGAIAFGWLICVLLVFCEDIISTTFPILVLTIFLTRMYDSYDIFIKYKYMAIPVIFSLLFHFVVYRKKITIGPSFWGICAVAVAVSLGGFMSVSANDYFRAVNLYYVIGLGVGAVVFYLLAKSQLIERDYYNLKEKFLVILYLMGVFACFIVLRAHLIYLDEIIENKTIVYYIDSMIISTNNIATFLMFALPVPFYFSLKNKVHLLSGYAFFLCLLLTGSRSAMLMGIIEFVFCLAYICIFDKEKRILNSIVSLATLVLGGIILYRYIWFFGPDSLFSSDILGDDRYKLLQRSLTDFKTSPIFGKGLAYSGNTDIYTPKTFAMNWYHMFPSQVIGSFGALGIIAYLFNIVSRLAIILKKFDPYVWVLGVSYIGIFLMTMINPGEFCPLPYGMLAVALFIFAEQGMSSNLKALFKIEKNK